MTERNDNLFGSFETVEQEKTSCPVCDTKTGDPAGSVSSHGAIFSYIICHGCGMKYMNPRPSAAWYQAHYQNFFWEYKVDNKSWRDSAKKWRLRDIFKRGNKGRMKVQQKRVAQLIPQLEENSALSSGKALLDIGCAYGAIGKHLIDHFDCEVWGVEPNETAREIATNKNGLKIYAHAAEELATSKKIKDGFSVIMFSNVLENILDPVSVVSSCKKLLAKDGVICVHTPNFYFYDAMNPYHPWIFSSESLINLFGRAGFKVLNVIEKDVAEAIEQGQKIDKNEKFSTLFFKPGKSNINIKKPDIAELLDQQEKCLKLTR